MNILDCSATNLAQEIKEGKISVWEAVEEVLQNIDKKEKELNCFISIENRDRLKEKAYEIDEKIRKGFLKGPLAGVPISIKDNICSKGMKTTCGSKMLENFIPAYDAKVVKKIKEEGLIIIGKTNMDEFAMGNSTQTSYFGPVKNPLNANYIAGGSSGGSAGSVAGNESFISLGSDTGGSIRQPAAFCGLVGLKPTYGSVSRNGLIAYSSSFDQIGPIGKNVEDCANAFNIILGRDRKDSTSTESPKVDISRIKAGNIKGMKIGIPKNYFNQILDPSIGESLLKTAKKLEKKGAILEEFDLEYLDYLVPTYYIISCAQASSNLERFDGVKYGYRHQAYESLHDMYKKTRTQGFGQEVKMRILTGSFLLSSGYYDEYYLKALKVRTLLKNEFDKAFTKYDLILSPVYPDKVPKIEEKLDDPLKNYMSDIYTVAANLMGIPAISLPCRKDQNGMPVGIQFMADCFNEEKLFILGKSLEETIS